MMGDLMTIMHVFVTTTAAALASLALVYDLAE
jgi:hypothetical protein